MYTFPLSVSVNPSNLAIGTYHDSVVVTPEVGPPATLPAVFGAGIQRGAVYTKRSPAASGFAGPVSPGKILTMRGYGVGASELSGFKLDASGTLELNLNGLQVAFDGKAAPLLYTSANQTNLIVPYEVAGKASTVVQSFMRQLLERSGPWHACCPLRLPRRVSSLWMRPV
jgi:hypothetical protein